VLVLALATTLGACATSSSPSPAPAETRPAAPSPSAGLEPAPRPSGSPAPGGPTSSPAPSALVLGGTWLLPKEGAELTSYATTLAAKPTAAGAGVTTFTKVVFSGTWAGAATSTMCTATSPADSGEWRCHADLLALHVPPGAVTFSFDVYGEGVPVARSPDGGRRVTYAVPPPKPTNPRWTTTGGDPAVTGATTQAYRLRWAEPAHDADEFLIYNTWECPRKNAGTPCFAAGTPVDAGMLELLRSAPGDARSVRLSLPVYECGPSYGTILMRAQNAFGRSPFTIVEAALVPDPGDIIC
jgi:hypothetical protein